jgi:predicted RNA-binding protein YlxR (DUF448 family)
MGCRTRRGKNEMVRYLLNRREGRLIPSEKGQCGRGFYLCPEVSCLQAAKKRYRFEIGEEVKEEKA